MIITVLHHFQVGVEKLDQPGVYRTSTAIEITPVVCLDDAKNVVQRRHHEICSQDIPLSYDCAVHGLDLKCCPIFFKPLMDPGGWTAGRHDSARKNPTKFFPKKNIPKIFLLGQQKFSRITAVQRTFKKRIISKKKSKEFQHGSNT